MTRRTSSRLAAAVLATAAAGLTLHATAQPAHAGTCSTSSGVTVIVDFKQLDGGIQGSCVAGGAGKAASTLFPAAGFALDYVQNEPGFVCRVSGLPKPQDDPCVDTPPTTRYWGLWWSDGKSGTWKYANYGVAALKVPDGAYVALAWKQGTGSASPPGVTPAVHQAPTPTAAPTSSAADPTKAPSGDPTKDPTKGPTASPGAPGTTAGSSAAASPAESTGVSVSGSPTAGPSGSSSPTPTAPVTSGAPTPTASDSVGDPAVQDPVAPTDPGDSGDPEAAEASDGGVPFVLVVLLIAALFVASGAAVVLRRRRDPSAG